MKTILRTFVGCTAILFGTACMGAVKYVPENMKVELYRCTGCLLQLSSIVEYGLSP